MRTLVVAGKKYVATCAGREERCRKNSIEAHPLNAPQMLLPRTERASQERMDVVDFGGKGRGRSVH